MRRTAPIILFAVCLLAGTAAASDLADLADRMTGSFSSAAQAEADTNFYDIRLQMARIWPDRDDGVWLYVEQAAGWSLDMPYRQRVYRVTEAEPGLFRSAVYALPDDEAAIGAWRDEAPLGDLDPDALSLREGCAVFLRRGEGGDFAGGTVGRGCGSSLRGASYATSEVVVGADRIESWDRGFDADGVQVWGAETGPYVFLRTAP